MAQSGRSRARCCSYRWPLPGLSAWAPEQNVFLKSGCLKRRRHPSDTSKVVVYRRAGEARVSGIGLVV